ncbi:hypothetical protein Scep_009240 [Stephania cephalantha]|uniref:Uncharacterized protein n=1 Tax=Stephania cephalantha TaxID=152367 RepID=A0AAP0JTD6_9MAGN
MAQQGVCSAGVVRLVLFLVSACLVCYVVGPTLLWHLSGKFAVQASCPSCVCDCSLETILSIPLGFINSSFTDCSKRGTNSNGESEDIVDLLSEELNLQRNVTNDNMAHTRALILEARKTSSQYQKEAEKCNAGVEACEEAREKAEAALIAEKKLSAVWESRARELGWQDRRNARS